MNLDLDYASTIILSVQKLVTVSMEQRQVEKLSYPNPSPPKDLKADIFTKENFAQVDNYARKV